MKKEKKNVGYKPKKCWDCKYCYRRFCCNAESDKVGKTVWPWTKACKRWTENK